MTAEAILELTVLGVALAAVASVLGGYLLTGAPPLPTTAAVKRVMLAALPDRLDGAVYDLGSGWGGMAFALARRYPGCRVTGYEVSPLPWAFSRLRLLLQPVPNLHFRHANFHKASQADAALVVCYLSPAAMGRLKQKLETELERDALVLCNFFRMPGWQAVSEHIVPDMHATAVYLYRIGDRNSASGPSPD